MIGVGVGITNIPQVSGPIVATPPNISALDAYKTDSRTWINVPWGPESWSEPTLGGEIISQLLDLHLPAGTAPATGWPCVMYFHANGATFKSIDSAYRAGLLAAGIAVAAVEFRHPVTNVDEGAPHVDVGRATQFLRSFIPSLPLDTAKFGATTRSRGALALWQSLQPDMAFPTAPTWAGRMSSRIHAVWAYNPQTTYSTTEFVNLFVVPEDRAAALLDSPDDPRWGSAIQSVADCATPPEVIVLHTEAYPTEQRPWSEVSSNKLHYPGFGAALRDAFLARGLPIDARASVPNEQATVGSTAWFVEKFYGVVPTGESMKVGGNVPSIGWLNQLPITLDAMQGAAGWAGPGNDTDNPPPLDANRFPMADGSIKVFNSNGSIPTWFHGVYTLEYRAKVPGSVGPAIGSQIVVGAPAIVSGPDGNGDFHYRRTVDTTGSTTGTLYMNFLSFPDGIRNPRLWRPGVNPDAPGGRFTAIAKRVLGTYAAYRFMDWENVNANVTGDFADREQEYGWMREAERATPLEMQMGLASELPGIPYFTCRVSYSIPGMRAYGDWLAANLPAGRKIRVGRGNEPWNTGPGFYCYRYNGEQAMREAAAWVPVGQNYPGMGYGPGLVESVTSDGTRAFITFSAPHGVTAPRNIASMGWTETALRTPNGGAPCVVESPTVLSYPTAAAAGTSATMGVEGSCVCLNVTDLLWNNLQNFNYLHFRYNSRMSFHLATQVRAAFNAVGRGGDLQTIYEWQTRAVADIRDHFFSYLRANYGEPADVFTHGSTGAYVDGRNQLISGGGFTNDEGAQTNTPELVLAALDRAATHADQRWLMSSMAALWLLNGMLPGIYEIGTDTAQFVNQVAAAAANTLPGIEVVVRKVLHAHYRHGFHALEWYRTGVSANYADTANFNVANTVEQTDPASDPADLSPKFRALLAAKTDPAPVGDFHVSGGALLTIDGRDHVGNRFWSGAAAYPTLGAGVPNQFLLSGTHTVYYVWSAEAKTVQLSLDVLLTTIAASTCEVRVNSRTAAITFPLPVRGSSNTATEVLPAVPVPLSAGANYIAIGNAGSQNLRVRLRQLSLV